MTKSDDLDLFVLTDKHRRYLRAFDAYLAARTPAEIRWASGRLRRTFAEEYPGPHARGHAGGIRKRAA